MSAVIPLSYVMPLRWSEDSAWGELEVYLQDLAPRVSEVIIVDGSPGEIFRRHARSLEGLCRHIPPDPRMDFKMGKVNGVTTGVLAARCERVVIADDDVRYDAAGLDRLARLLDEADLVRPQNYFDPLPWHARLDTARTLLNRVHTGDREFPRGDFPGTLGVRRSAFEAIDGYDGDVMFENLELMRSIQAAGGRVASPLNFYVRRLPPGTSHYLSQRVRQAYDDFGIPVRMLVALAILPLALLIGLRRRGLFAFSAGGISAVAELGRWRAGGRQRYSSSSSLLAPVWVLERGMSAWLALWSRARHGGIPYAGEIIPRGANSTAELRRRLGSEAGHLVGPIAERMDARVTTAADRDSTPA